MHIYHVAEAVLAVCLISLLQLASLTLTGIKILAALVINIVSILVAELSDAQEWAATFIYRDAPIPKVPGPEKKDDSHVS